MNTTDSLLHWLPDITIGAVVFVLLWGVVVTGAILAFKDLWPRLRQGQWPTVNETIAVLFACFAIWGLPYAAYKNVQRDHYLRVGPVRYSAAVVERYHSRGWYRFNFDFYVDGQLYEGSAKCGGPWNECYPPGRRLYVRFWPGDPDWAWHLLPVAVPENVGEPPAQGWSRLP